jgi:flagellar hook protein FlgE
VGGPFWLNITKKEVKMMRSISSALAGMKVQQTKLDVISNNIANIDTVGYKSSRVTFADVISQTLKSASAPGTTGGTNPMQIGLGVIVSSIDMNTSQGGLSFTGLNTDVAIQGKGWFIVEKEGNIGYTRAGNFSIDGEGNVVSANGWKVLGWLPDVNGNFVTEPANITPLKVDFYLPIPAIQTTNITLQGNLDANTTIGGTTTTSINVYDSLGMEYIITITFQKTGVNTWNYTVSVTPPSGVTATMDTNADEGTITFNADGSLSSFTYEDPGNVIRFTTDSGASTPIEFDFSPGTINGFDGLTQFSGDTNAMATKQNGYPTGNLQEFGISEDGVISGSYSNGIRKALGLIALAVFQNDSGLIREGNNIFYSSENSGVPKITPPGKMGAGSIAPQTLESSNVDLAAEFSEMIIAQRSFQANSRAIITADTILEELLRLKR